MNKSTFISNIIPDETGDLTSQVILGALPDAILITADDGKIVYVNLAAEQFFASSSTVLLKQTLEQVLPFGSPLLSLISQVVANGSSVREYAVDLGTPKTPTQKVDVQVAPIIEAPGNVMVIIQQRSIADKMDW